MYAQLSLVTHNIFYGFAVEWHEVLSLARLQVMTFPIGIFKAGCEH